MAIRPIGIGVVVDVRINLSIVRRLQMGGGKVSVAGAGGAEVRLGL